MAAKKYYLGLDIGTDSVGFCVTDENYNIIKKHKVIYDGKNTMYMMKETKGRDGHPFLSRHFHHVISYDAERQWV